MSARTKRYFLLLKADLSLLPLKKDASFLLFNNHLNAPQSLLFKTRKPDGFWTKCFTECFVMTNKNMR